MFFRTERMIYQGYLLNINAYTLRVNVTFHDIIRTANSLPYTGKLMFVGVRNNNDNEYTTIPQSFSVLCVLSLCISLASVCGSTFHSISYFFPPLKKKKKKQ